MVYIQNQSLFANLYLSIIFILQMFFKKNSSETNKMLRDFIAYSDGKTSIFDICDKINASLDQVREI